VPYTITYPPEADGQVRAFLRDLNLHPVTSIEAPGILNVATSEDAQNLNVRLKVHDFIESLEVPATSVNVAPIVITELAEKSAPINGQPFDLQVSGDESGRFNENCVILINGTAYPTALTDANTLESAGIDPSTLGAGGIVGAPGSLYVTVQESHVTSNFLLFELQPPQAPAPVLSSLDPSSFEYGLEGFTLTLKGSDFVEGALVLWNGKTRTATFVDPTELTVVIAAYDLKQETIPVFVRNLDRQVSETLEFTVAGAPAAKGAKA
jgi:hypothetical protein